MKIFLELAPLLVINCLFIYGIFISGTYRLRSDLMVIPEKIKMEMIDPDSREILTGLRIRIENLFGPFYSKPLITCPICMASVHSIALFSINFWDPQEILLRLPVIHQELWISFPFKPEYLLLYPFYVCSLAALNKATKGIFVND